MTFCNPSDKLNFGKNKGHLLKDIYKYQPSYIEWLILNVEDFAINIEAFITLPKPTPIGYGFVRGTAGYKKIMNDNSSLFEKFSKTDQNQLVSIDDIYELIESGFELNEINYEFPKDVVISNNQKIENI